MRLQKHYSTRLKTAFDPNYKTIKDGNASSSTVAGRTTMSEKDKQEADELMSKVKS
jgi:hypothetical protein